jgi:hypothetical protein
MQWQKRGLVYVPRGELPWAVSYAYIPTTYLLDAETIRVYVAFLDEHKVGRVGFVDVAAADPLKILRVSQTPVLDIGAPGTFDDSGVTPTCIVPQGSKLYLYYVGWQVGVKIRYTLLTGLAISEDGGESFVRHRQVPILERSDRELFVRSAACVLPGGQNTGQPHSGQQNWQMWYVAGDRWIEVNGKPVPTYNLRYLRSPNGLDWPSEGRVCLDLASPDEYGFGRPFVYQEAGLYKLWYSIRTVSQGYRIGYGESEDGLTWQRQDHRAGIEVSPQGWDSQMIHCSCIQPTQYGTYLFYNGNNYGETGFGVACLNPE